MEPHDISPKDNSTDLNTPPENFSYNTGRWNEEEHQKFIEGILEYGNEWKSVQKIVKTRSSTQARSHAQKFVLSIKKLMEKKNFESKENLIDFILQKYIIKNNRVITEKNKQKLFSVITQGIFENSSDSENNINEVKNKQNIGVKCGKILNEKNREECLNNFSGISNNSKLIVQKNLFYNDNNNIIVNGVINNNSNSVFNIKKETIFNIRKDPSNINRKRQRLLKKDNLKKDILKENLTVQNINNKNCQNINNNYQKNRHPKNINNKIININLNNNLNNNSNIIHSIFSNPKFEISRDSYQISPDSIQKTEKCIKEEHTEYNNNQTDPFKLDFDNYQDNNSNSSDNDLIKSQLNYYSYDFMNVENENNFDDLYLNH